MTIVAAAIGPDGVWIGSDGRSQVNGLVNSQACRKWTLSPAGDWAVSHSGSMAFIGIAASIVGAEGFAWPSVHDEAGAVALMTALRLGLQRLSSAGGGVATKTESDSTIADWYWSPLLVSPVGLWRCDSSLWATSPAIEGAFHAAGSGEDLALGAMSALRVGGCTSAQHLVEAAIDTASRLSATCGGERWMRRMGPRVAGVVAA